ncbi:myosin-7 [Cucumis melo var. makuwa]|uniref:Myosin-7 n=1 Tax=Cucumis melo var. makuwa TaxID=1194695 RepID=A0A5D3BGN0_CUCMM|nr:myosin-7 [Cucumis melo var. makuwa]
MNVTFCYCAATIGGLGFTDKSDWIRKRNFSLESELFQLLGLVPCAFNVLAIERRCRQEVGSILLVDSHNRTFIGSECDELSLICSIHVNSLSEAHKEDKLRIESLEKELTNCTEEIGTGNSVYGNQLETTSKLVMVKFSFKKLALA